MYMYCTILQMLLLQTETEFLIWLASSGLNTIQIELFNPRVYMYM